MVFNKKVYDILKWIAQILLPAVGALYFGLADIWNLPKATEVVGTITVVDAFLGILLGLSTASYNRSDAKYDGVIAVHEDPISGKKTYDLILEGEPEAIDDMDQVIFRVRK